VVGASSTDTIDAGAEHAATEGACGLGIIGGASSPDDGRFLGAGCCDLPVGPVGEHHHDHSERSAHDVLT
jgi:hypothetical protein